MKAAVAFGMVLLVGWSSQALAINQRVASELQKLEPEEELEQRCDVEALNQIDSARKDLFPDKVIAYTFSPPLVKGDTIDAKGAVFRSHEHWYHLSYHCKTDTTELKITDFDFKIGNEIPRSQWEKNYLYP